MLRQRLMWIVWPAFLTAGVLEMLIFAMVDPQNVHWFGTPLEWSRQAIYTGAFFVFWAVGAVSGGLTTLLSMSPFEVNRCPLPTNRRPEDCSKEGGC
jgi:hypothetical protein